MAQDKVLMTQDKYEELERERKELEKKLSANRQDISDARSQGDLSENADYKAAREEQNKLEERKREIDYLLSHADIQATSDNNNLDKMVKVKFLDDGFIDEYHIVGAVGADPIKNEISSESPLGMAIFKAHKGEKVTVLTEDNDRFEVEILDITSQKKDRRKKND